MGSRAAGTGGDEVRYAELQCQSAFSFLRGASEPEGLVERAAALGYAGLALADRDGLYGCPRLHAAGKERGLHAIHGTTLTLESAGRASGARGHGSRGYDGTPRRADDRIVLLALDASGWGSLCRLVSAARHRDRRAPTTPLSALCHQTAGLAALAGPDLPDTTVQALHESFGPDDLFLTVHDRLLHRDRRGQARQQARSRHLGRPLLVTGGVRFAHASDKPLHDVLTCVRHKVALDEAAHLLLPNAEFHLRPPAVIAHLFRHCPDAVTRTVELAQRCSWSLDALAYRFPPFDPPPGETPFSLLHKLTHTGSRRRYRPLSPAAARQIARELDLIERLDLAGYFLVVHDIVRFCNEQKILCQGRGSAANSAVCYALGITAVDPVGMDLLFERFLSEERGEMPDIDLDIAHQDRERVLQYVYDKYGREHATMAAEVITYRARSAVRDAAKALGFGTARSDALAKGIDRRWDGDAATLPPGWSGSSTGGTGNESDDPRLHHLLAMATRMSGLPRHLSIHVGGFIVTGPPLHDMMPTEPAAMAGRTVVPWDKDDLNALGIIKIDLLGLGMLTVLDRCLTSVSATRREQAAGAHGGPGGGPREGGLPDGAPIDLALHTVPRTDEATWDMLCAADTVGVFQVESRAQMNCLPRLRPRCFYDLVVEVALIRPGPIQGDMVHPYLRRRAGTEPVTYPHPSLKPILQRTLGVPLFQEQGMKIAVTAAGFTGGEADELRRAMGHKRSRARMAEMSARLVDGMVRHGIRQALAERILKQLSAFADYGFPESHAASFAHLVWVSAWLKRHYPEHFLCAMLNAQPMGFYSPATLISDAQRHGVVVGAVDVLQSGWDSTLQWMERAKRAKRAKRTGGSAVLGVRLGLGTVRGIGEKHEQGVREGLASVERLGPFVSPEDFAQRTGLSRVLMENLARLGALRGFDERRRHALWEVARMARSVPGPLAEPLKTETDPVGLLPMTAGETVREDYALGGASVERHPLELLRAQLDAKGVLPAKALGVAAERTAPTVRPGQKVAVAGMVICRQRPQTASGMTFVTLEDETGFANLIVMPPVGAAYRTGLHAVLMLAVGRVERSGRVVNIKAESLHALDGEKPLQGMRSHDYR